MKCKTRWPRDIRGKKKYRTNNTSTMFVWTHAWYTSLLICSQTDNAILLFTPPPLKPFTYSVIRTLYNVKLLFQLKNVRPKVDNKAPTLDIGAFYRIAVFKRTAIWLTQIEDENLKIIKNINVIGRTKVTFKNGSALGEPTHSSGVVREKEKEELFSRWL